MPTAFFARDRVPSFRNDFLELADDLLRLFTRERTQRLGVLGAVAVELHQDLDRDLVVGSLEDLDDVVAAERDVDADQLAARVRDDLLALLDALAPLRQARIALRPPAHQRDVMSDAANICGGAPERL